MSLISTKNLIAPLTNKLHMITIVLLTIGFVALRLSGGALHVHSTPDIPAERQTTDRLSADQTLPAEEMLKKIPASRRKEPYDPHYLNRVVNDIKPPWEQKKTAAQPTSSPPAPPKKRGGLADIEKALGMK